MQHMKKTFSGILILLLMFWSTFAWGDILLLINKKEYRGQLKRIAAEYVEFVNEETPGESEWIKIYKKDLLVVVNERGKIIYPRDKYDENALNYGKVRLKTRKEVEIYNRRIKHNQQVQRHIEQNEKNRYKVAALVGGLGGLMIWAFIDSR